MVLKRKFLLPVFVLLRKTRDSVTKILTTSHRYHASATPFSFKPMRSLDILVKFRNLSAAPVNVISPVYVSCSVSMRWQGFIWWNNTLLSVLFHPINSFNFISFNICFLHKRKIWLKICLSFIFTGFKLIAN